MQIRVLTFLNHSHSASHSSAGFIGMTLTASRREEVILTFPQEIVTGRFRFIHSQPDFDQLEKLWAF